MGDSGDYSLMVVSSRSILSSSVLLSFSISGCSMWVSAPDSQVIGISVETPPQRIDSELGSECSHAFFDGGTCLIDDPV